MRSLGIVLTLVLSIFPASARDAESAPLRAIAAVDAAETWVVGDDGTILHSIDSGKTWERQLSGTRASLRGIHMLSPYVGWVVGRTELPGKVGSLGVMLHTTNGGATWADRTTTVVPGLHNVRFFDEQNGWVVGTTTDVGPTGAFRTRNAGRTWEPLRGPRTPGWAGVLPATLDAGLLVGQAGAAVVRQDRFASHPTLTNPLAAIVRHPEGYLLFGERGEVTRLRDNGSTEAATAATKSLGFRSTSACAVGSTVWAVGRPGSVVPVSTNFGATWQHFPTPTTAGLHAIQMVDAEFGYAVGDYGTILQTKNGGRTWAVQRAAGSQAAMLAVVEELTPAILPMVAKHGDAEGYHLAAVVRKPMDEARASAAWHAAGGMVVQVQPDAGSAALVAAIRTHRPAVIVTDIAGMDAAVKQAADPSSFPEQLAELNLTPHQVTRVIRCGTGDAFDANEFHSSLALSFSDRAEAGMRLIEERLNFGQVFRLQTDGKAAFEGIALAEQGPSRRSALGVPTESAATLAERKRALKIRLELMQSLERAATAKDHQAAVQAISAQLAVWPGEASCRAALQFAEACERLGHWSAARFFYAWMLEHHPLQTESALAIPRLARIHGSQEIRRQLLKTEHGVALTGIFEPTQTAGDVEQVSSVELPADFTPKFRTRFVSGQALRRWEDFGLSLDGKLAAFGAGYMRETDGRLARASQQRRAGLVADADRLLRTLLALNPADPKSDPAAVRLREELRLLHDEPTEQPLIPRLPAYKTATRPVLDGKLGDECWKAAKPVLVSVESKLGHATTARFAFDDQFLYLSVECARHDYKPAEKSVKREYDADLSGHERFEIMIDTDRDHATYFRLAVDERGCTADDCCDDKSWNPRWFVAAAGTETGWTTECAIPLAELGDGVKVGGQVWNVKLARKRPGLSPLELPAGYLKFVEK